MGGMHRVQKGKGPCDLMLEEKQALQSSKDSRMQGKMRTKAEQDSEYTREFTVNTLICPLHNSKTALC